MDGSTLQPLTPKEAVCLAHLVRECDAGRASMTNAQIAKAFRGATTGAISEWVRALFAKGYVRTDNGGARSRTNNRIQVIHRAGPLSRGRGGAKTPKAVERMRAKMAETTAIKDAVSAEHAACPWPLAIDFWPAHVRFEDDPRACRPEPPFKAPPIVNFSAMGCSAAMCAGVGSINRLGW